jgi:hypothetical protein
MSSEVGRHRHDVVERALERSRSERERRLAILQSARRSRKRARELRQHAFLCRDASLEQRWRLWSAGVIPEPPGLVPESWRAEREQDLDDVLTAAAAACVDCRDAALTIRRAIIIAGLTDVAAARIRERSDGFEFLVSATARLIDQLEPTMRANDAAEIVCLSAMRRCRETCRTALVALKA